MDYDALLFVSFGGPEAPEHVLPFLENVLRGRNVPRQRMLEVAEHYQRFGGVSPINKQNRALIAALEQDFRAIGLEMPIYWGNRNWDPLLPDTLQAMADDGIRHALAFFTSAYSSYSGCRQYRENIEAARQQVGPAAPQFDKLRMFYNHPGFVESTADRLQGAFTQLPPDRRDAAHLLFTAHSIPVGMADHCRYEQQLRESCRLVAQSVGKSEWQLVYQSRSGPPSQPWLEPDIGDALQLIARLEGSRDVVVMPIGFLSDHIEILFDLDHEAREQAAELGLSLIRSPTVGTHPRFVRMVGELVLERLDSTLPRPALGTDGPSHDECPVDCCRYEPRRPTSSS